MTDTQFADSLYKLLNPKYGGGNIDIYWENAEDINKGIEYIKNEANNPNGAPYALKNSKTCGTEARKAYNASLSAKQLKTKSKPINLPYLKGLPSVNIL